jgi:hypothetical protein
MNFEDEIEWLEIHVNGGLTWEDVMYMRMERFIARQIIEVQEWKEVNKRGKER